MARRPSRVTGARPRRDPAATLTVGLLWLLLALFVVYPLVALLARVLFDQGRFTPEGIAGLLVDGNRLRARVSTARCLRCWTPQCCYPLCHRPSRRRSQ